MIRPLNEWDRAIILDYLSRNEDEVSFVFGNILHCGITNRRDVLRCGDYYGYFEGDRDIRLVVQLIDMRHPPTSDDIKMIDYMTDNEIPFIIALTKADKLNKSGREQRLKALESELYDYIGVKIIPFSSKSGEGVGELRSVLSAAVKG